MADSMTPGVRAVKRLSLEAFAGAWKHTPSDRPAD
jgi:hypothetical protein